MNAANRDEELTPVDRCLTTVGFFWSYAPLLENGTADSGTIGLHEVREDAFWCAGHFPGNPVMPGVLIAEALAQVAALIHLSAHPEAAGSTVLLAGMDKLRFRKPVRPGCTLRLKVEAAGARRGIYKFDATAFVGDQRVANGQFIAAVAEPGS